MWKLFLAVVLILIIWLLYVNDYGVQKSVDDVKKRFNCFRNADSMSVRTDCVRGIYAPAVSSVDVTAPIVVEGENATPVVVPTSEEPKKEGFCPKLMQKYGFCNAGESMNPVRGSVWDSRYNNRVVLPGRRETIQGRRILDNVASNTNWSGYMERAVLPNY